MRYDGNMKVFDGHNDTILEIFSPDPGHERSFFQKNTIGQLDLPRVRLGGFGGGLFSLYIPAPIGSPERNPHYGLTITEDGYRMPLPSALNQTYAENFINSELEFLKRLEQEARGKVKLVTNFQELDSCWKNEILSMVLHFEGAEAIRADISNLEHFYEQGLRSLGIVWSRPNVFGNGVPFMYPHSPDTGEGLTQIGKKLVYQCNQSGIMLDLAHLNEKGFWDVAKISDKPLVVSHAGIYELNQSSRNITDNQLEAIKKTNGIIGIMFEPILTRSDGKPNKETSLRVIIEHIQYVVDKIGIDYVGIGSDFDGAKMPLELKDVTGLPKLIGLLQSIGYDTDSIEKIASKNWLRVLRETWKE